MRKGQNNKTHEQLHGEFQSFIDNAIIRLDFEKGRKSCPQPADLKGDYFYLCKHPEDAKKVRVVYVFTCLSGERDRELFLLCMCAGRSRRAVSRLPGW